MSSSQEGEAFGGFLLDVISEIYGCDPRPEAIDRAVYKNTECGAWCKFDEIGIKVGTIVEGSDAEFATRVDLTGIDMDEAGAALLRARFLEALQAAEDFVEAAFADAIREDEQKLEQGLED